MSDKLLPCPFCGGEAKRKLIKPYRKIKGRGQSYLAIIGCKTVGCTVEVSQAAFSREEAWEYAEKLWNRRAAGWIPVKERLPEENVDCLVYPASEEIAIARLIKGKFCSWWFDAFDSPDWIKVDGIVTHWMPLPKLPELCEGGGIDVTIQ